MRVGFRPNIARPLGGSGIAPGSGGARITPLQAIFAKMFPAYIISATELKKEAGTDLLFTLKKKRGVEEFKLLCTQEKTSLYGLELNKFNPTCSNEVDLIIDSISEVIGRGKTIENTYQWNIGLSALLELFFPPQKEVPLTVTSLQSWLDKKFSAKLSGYQINGKQVSGSKEHGFKITIRGRFFARNGDEISFDFKWFIHPVNHSVKIDYADKKVVQKIIQDILFLLFPGVASFDEVTMEKLREAVYTAR